MYAISAHSHYDTTGCATSSIDFDNLFILAFTGKYCFFYATSKCDISMFIILT